MSTRFKKTRGRFCTRIPLMFLRRDLSKKVEEGAPPRIDNHTTFATIKDKIPQGNENTTYSSNHTQSHSSIEYPFIEKHPQDNIPMRMLQLAIHNTAKKIKVSNIFSLKFYGVSLPIKP
jgi:hypothetical protein